MLQILARHWASRKHGLQNSTPPPPGGGGEEVNHIQPVVYWFRCGSRHIDAWFALKAPNVSKDQLLEHINQDIKRR